MVSGAKARSAVGASSGTLKSNLRGGGTGVITHRSALKSAPPPAPLVGASSRVLPCRGEFRLKRKGEG